MDGMTRVDLGETAAAHTHRVTSIDPLLPVLPVPQLAQGNELIGEGVEDSVAVGVARFSEPDPASLLATWGALRQHVLAVRLSGGDALEPALDALLTRWDQHLARTATPGDDEAAAMITWASRDTAPIPALIRHGFAPLVVIAARVTRPAPPTRDAGVRIRRATADDLDVLVDFNLAVVDHDTSFGVARRRPSSRDGLRDGYTQALTRADPGLWLADRAGEPVGMIAVDVPPDANWIAGLVGLAPVGYVGCMYVRDEERGGGVGSALVTEAHQTLADAGAAVTLLHHSLANPRSTPFWYTHGYRPLWTMWQRRPAVN
jgi:GNAT superfamily N-acetyltransferase